MMRKRINVKKIGALFLSLVMLLSITPLGMVQAKAASVFDLALNMELGDTVTCYPASGNSSYYKFTVEGTGIVRFDITSKRQDLYFYLCNSDGKYLVNEISSDASKGSITRMSKYYRCYWNSTVAEFAGAVSFELAPGEYGVLLECSGNDKGAAETTISTTFSKTDARESLDVNDSITCYPASGNSKKYIITVKEKGIIKFNISSERQDLYFYLYDSDGKYLVNEISSDASKGSITRMSKSYRCYWNSTVAEFAGSVSFELAPGEYGVLLECSGSDEGSPKTTLKTSFTSSETKTTKSLVIQLEISKGSSLKLNTILNPTDSTSAVTWSSSKKSVCTVSSKGVVKALKTGTCVITAKSNGHKAKIRIKVVK